MSKKLIIPYVRTAARGILKAITGTDVSSDKRAFDVIIYGSDGSTPKISECALSTTSMRHCKVSCGLLFHASKVWEDLADDGFATYLVTCHANYHVMTYFEFNSEGAAIIELYETPTVTGNGTAVTPRNMNRNYSDVLNTLVFHTPTCSADGTLLKQKLIGSGKAGSGQGDAVHWHLKKGLSYYVKIKNVSGQVKTVSASIKFFETENGG